MNHDAEAQQVLRTLVGRFGSQLVPPTVEELEATAKGLADLLGFTVDVKAIVLQAREQISHRMGEGVSLIGPDAAHDPNWLSHRAIEWKYSDSYLEFLRQDGWPPRVADSLGMVTRRLVGYLQDPEVEGTGHRPRPVRQDGELSRPGRTRCRCRIQVHRRGCRNPQQSAASDTGARGRRFCRRSQ